MSDIQTLKSYLVGLGFDVNQQQFKKFNSTLADAAKMVNSETGKIASSVLKWEGAIVGMFGTVSAAILGTIDHVITADQEYRLFGERMFMSTQNAKALKIALDALGQPLEAIAFDPELHNRFIQLQHDQKALQAGLGGDFETNMVKMRDFSFELTRLKVELQYLAMGTVNEIFKALGLGSGDFLKTLRNINDWIINNVPRLAKQFATYLVPILKDTWMIAKDIGKLLAIIATEFTNIVSVFSGDSSLASATFNFDKFARAIDKVVNGLAWVIDHFIKIQQFLGNFSGGIAGAAIGGAIGSVIPGVGTGVGAAIGGGIGLGADLAAHIAGARAGRGGSGAATGLADEARQLAKRIAADTGADPALVFAQFAHETGNFKSRAALQLNNLAGIETNGQYRSYGSLDDFANDYEKVITNQRRYPGLTQARTPEEFAHIAKRGGYYSDYESNYSRGMRNALPSYGGGGNTTHISVGDINVMQPNASADEIARTVTDRISEKQYKENQRNLAMLQPAFQ